MAVPVDHSAVETVPISQLPHSTDDCVQCWMIGRCYGCGEPLVPEPGEEPVNHESCCV